MRAPRFALLSIGLLACDPPVQHGMSRLVPSVTLQRVAEGLTSPVALAGDHHGGRYVVDQVGLVYDLAAPIDPAHAFLDVRDRVIALDPGYDERGLLGLAFHPDYPADPRVFVWYSAPGTAVPQGYDHVNRLSSFVVADGRVDPASETVLLELPHPAANHNGGGPIFGPNGWLYLGVGDGGGAGDVGIGHPPGGNGQNPSTLFGAILRLDVNGTPPYAIPTDNPFATGGGAPEVFAYGFRNPWGMAFDTHTGELFVPDAGEELAEEVDLVHTGGDYGWNLREGLLCFDPAHGDVPPPTCPDASPLGAPLVAPILTFPHPGAGVRGDPNVGPDVEGEVIVGGEPVRAPSLPAWEGHYLFGTWATDEDSGTGALFLGTRHPDGWRSARVRVADNFDGQLDAYLLRVAADDDGELYVLTTRSTGPSGTTGTVWKLTGASP
jgi:glucose/arabinose dehydrogenase